MTEMEYAGTASSSQVVQSTTQTQPVMVQAAQAQPATTQAQVWYSRKCSLNHITTAKLHRAHSGIYVYAFVGVPDPSRSTNTDSIQRCQPAVYDCTDNHTGRPDSGRPDSVSACECLPPSVYHTALSSKMPSAHHLIQVQLQTTSSSGQHAVVVQAPEQQNQLVYQQDGSAQIQAGNGQF